MEAIRSRDVSTLENMHVDTILMPGIRTFPYAQSRVGPVKYGLERTPRSEGSE